MTKKELPILSGEIDLEMKRLRSVVDELEILAREVGQTTPSKVQLMAAAGYLHNLYNGFENCLSRLARGVDEHMPEGPDAHRDLLDQLASAVRGIRPPVIDSRLQTELDEYRRFRHAFRHMYFFDLQWERMLPLIKTARQVCLRLDQSIRNLFSALHGSDQPSFGG